MARYSGSGWHFQSVRHSNARKYGKAGGKYAGWRTMTSAQRHNAKIDRIMENWHQQLKEKDNISQQKYNKSYDKLSNEEKHKIDYKHAEKKHYGVALTKDKLLEILPHGSGINFDWNIYEDKKGNTIAENRFDTMNEMGYYDAVVDFQLVIPKNNPEKFKLHFKGGSFGQYYAKKYMLRNYLEDIFQMAFEEAKVI